MDQYEARLRLVATELIYVHRGFINVEFLNISYLLCYCLADNFLYSFFQGFIDNFFRYGNWGGVCYFFGSGISLTSRGKENRKCCCYGFHLVLSSAESMAMSMNVFLIYVVLSVLVHPYYYSVYHHLINRPLGFGELVHRDWFIF